MAESTLTFEVTGLNCAGCAGRATKALAAVPDVADVSVNLATRMAHVEGSAQANTLENALKTAGYPAAIGKLRLSIEGMSCASCAGRVERALLEQPGVLDARVNLASETAEVRTLAGSLDGQTLARIVTQAGYPARLATDTTKDDAEARREAETGALKRDLILAAVLTLPVFVGEMGSHLIPALHHWIHGAIGQATWWIVQFVLTTAVLIGPGRRFFRIGLPLLAKGAPDMNSLVALGTLAAWGYSTLATFAPSLLPEASRAVYFEAAAVIVTLILFGRFLEARAKGRTGAAIKRLIGLRPDTARVEREGEIKDTPVEDIETGDIVHLRPGERVAVDGMVLTGRSFVDEAMITGEPVPSEKLPDAPLVAGTVNGQGALTYQATAVGSDTMLARIVAMVQDAQGARLPVQALADKVVAWFVPAVIALSVLTILAWLVFGPSLTFALVAGVSVLIIACPCAMGLATPTSIMVGTGRAAELGVLFRKGDALQRLDEVKVIAFDKTGTLTEGRPDLVSQTAAPGFDVADVLRLTAGAESGSEHPIARALERAAGADLPKPESTEAIPGYGLKAEIAGQSLLIGAPRLMERDGIDLTPLTDALLSMEAKGQTPVLTAIDGKIAAAFAVADRIKPGAVPAMQALRNKGLHLALITGDTEATAKTIARDLGIDHVEAEVLPEGKRDAVRALRDQYGPIAFCGDGINDAPALAEADVGLAIGTGTDVAIESADVVLSSGALIGAVSAVDISHSVMRNIRQNLFWAFGYNVLLIPVAAGVFYPFTGWLLSPMLAAGAMSLSSVFVVSNALRLRYMRSKDPARMRPETREATA
ncbi:heavy metal translocating P-type ATPase [Pacificoceanicola onchidii]|uniref:heavy metal translocating P-type ATPase n=1 Tax=Pacificoceanicola onchidii TaxID=2562685 RepID=UPI0010A2E300|nr:heavy metal translocating P-type ATPase [Pacificoceanicola onchidii]